VAGSPHPPRPVGESDFTLERVAASLGVTTEPATLFPGLSPLPVPAWLADTLAKNTPLTLISEKARSEFIVVPILRACREFSDNRLAIFSGQRLDVDPERELAGSARLWLDGGETARDDCDRC
jgi:hypothetical protein